MHKSTRLAPPSKPAKPHKDFPLFPHATRRWAKKVRGKFVFFGPWDDPDGALDKWLAWKDDLLAGRKPRITSEGLTLRDLANRFLTAKQQQLDRGGITPRTFSDYHSTCERLVRTLGLMRLVTDLAADDFEKLLARMAKTLGPVALGNEVQRVRVLFKYGYDAGLMDQPIRYGPMFKRPSRSVLRKARAANGVRMFEADELRRIIAAADQPLKAMILLGINCGFGNADVGMVPLLALDLKAGWVRFPRPKTGIERRAPLWPDTIAAIAEWLKIRPAAKNPADAKLVFVTKYGGCWHKNTAHGAVTVEPEKLLTPEGRKALRRISNNPVSQEMAKILKTLGLHRAGLGFYALRHSFETIGGETSDQVAVSYIMGHSPAGNDMASVYRERVDDARLKAVTDHVRAWLWPPKKKVATRKRKPR